MTAPTMEDHHADSRVGIWLNNSCTTPNTSDICHTLPPHCLSSGAQWLWTTILRGGVRPRGVGLGDEGAAQVGGGSKRDSWGMPGLLSCGDPGQRGAVA